ncbi:hypothetical protein [Bradyrhizobium sp. DN5]|uniref:hypothetical protein n=1 Tax=Bradyrhizobium sp. DN5 TaxID=3056950 RepID=UPI00352493BE
MITLLVGIQSSQLLPAGEMAQRSGLTPSETARDQIGMLRGQCSECCARSFRNPARHQVGTVRTIISESAGYQSKLFNPEFLRKKNLPIPHWMG